MVCSNCSYTSDVSREFRTNLCKNCCQYEKRTGNTRPERLWTKPNDCIYCGVDLSCSKYRYLCQSCYMYEYRYSIKRPPSLYTKKGYSKIE